MTNQNMPEGSQSPKVNKNANNKVSHFQPSHKCFENPESLALRSVSGL